MKLLGDANWWLPQWLDRLLPSMDSAMLPERDQEQEREPVPVGDRPSGVPAPRAVPGPAPAHSQAMPSLSPSVYQSYSGSVPL